MTLSWSLGDFQSPIAFGLHGVYIKEKSFPPDLSTINSFFQIVSPRFSALPRVSIMSPAAIELESGHALTGAAISKDPSRHVDHLISNPPLKGHSSSLAELDASKTQMTFTKEHREVPAPNSPEIWSQSICTDHMVLAKWTCTSGWEDPQLKPYGPLSTMPNAGVLPYATECFEGMKAFRGYDGKLRLFRPDRNCARMLISAARVDLPAFPPFELERLIQLLLAVDAPKWLPKDRPGDFLYVRPAMIATAAALGIQRPKEATLMVIVCPFPRLDEPTPPSSGPVVTNGLTDQTKNPASKFQGLKLLTSQDDMIRSWPGGFGYAKVGGNYGPTFPAQAEARERGYDQVLWLFGPERYVTEAGASNFFVVWKTRQGQVELVTAPLDDGLILDGVVRRSVLDLARQRLTGHWQKGDHGNLNLNGTTTQFEPLSVVERRFTMIEIEEAILDGRFIEAFVSGTAVSITRPFFSLFASSPLSFHVPNSIRLC